MEGVAIVAEGHPAIGRDIVDVNVLVEIDHELSLGMDLDQDLLLVHGLDHFAHVGSLLLEQLELLAQHAHFGVELVALSLKPTQILVLFRHGQLQILDLGHVVLLQAAQ